MTDSPVSIEKQTRMTGGESGGLYTELVFYWVYITSTKLSLTNIIENQIHKPCKNFGSGAEKKKQKKTSQTQYI